MAALDPYGVTDELEDALLDVMVTRLESRAKHWFFRKVMREYLDVIEIDSVGTVLEVGCGTGVAARTIARRAGFTGRITGIDLSPYLLQAARRTKKAWASWSSFALEIREISTSPLTVSMPW